jgi:hypothetical protein
LGSACQHKDQDYDGTADKDESCDYNSSLTSGDCSKKNGKYTPTIEGTYGTFGKTIVIPRNQSTVISVASRDYDTPGHYVSMTANVYTPSGGSSSLLTASPSGETTNTDLKFRIRKGSVHTCDDGPYLSSCYGCVDLGWFGSLCSWYPCTKTERDCEWDVYLNSYAGDEWLYFECDHGQNCSLPTGGNTKYYARWHTYNVDGGQKYLVYEYDAASANDYLGAHHLINYKTGGWKGVGMAGAGSHMTTYYETDVVNNNSYNVTLTPAGGQYGDAYVRLTVQDSTNGHAPSYNYEYIHVHVADAPTITTHPSLSPHQHVAGQTMTLTCDATGPPTPTQFKWYRNNTLVQDDSLKTLTITNLSSSHNGSYKCCAVNVANTTCSNVATLTLGLPPALGIPTSVTMEEDTTKTVTIQASDTYTPSHFLSVVAYAVNKTLLPDGSVIANQPGGGDLRRLRIHKVTVHTLDDGLFNNGFEVGIRVYHNDLKSEHDLIYDVELTEGQTVYFNSDINVTGYSRWELLEVDLVDDDELGFTDIPLGEGQVCYFDSQCWSSYCQGEVPVNTADLTGFNPADYGRCAGKDSSYGYKSTNINNPDHGNVTVWWRMDGLENFDSRTVSITPAPNQYGQTSVLVKATDPSVTTEKTMTVNVLPRCEMTDNNHPQGPGYPIQAVSDKTGNGVGYSECQGTSIGHHCTLKCPRGFSMTEGANNNVTTCLSNGEWSTIPLPVCQQTDAMEGNFFSDAVSAAQMALCNGFYWDWSVIPTCTVNGTNWCSWSGGDQDWAWAGYNLDVYAEVYNRKGKAQKVNEDIATYANWNLLNSACNSNVTCQEVLVETFGVEDSASLACEKEYECQEDGARAGAEAYAGIFLLGYEYKIIDAYLRGEIGGGRAGNDCNCGVDEYESWKGAHGLLEAHFTLFNAELFDYSFELPGEPVTFGPKTMDVMKKKCTTVIIGIIPLDFCIDLTAEVEMEIDAVPAFQIPDKFGLSVTPTPIARLNTHVAGGIGIQGAGFYLYADITLVELAFANNIDATVYTGICENNRPHVKLEGRGDLTVTTLDGSMGGEACMWGLGCSQSEWATWDGLEIGTYPIYEWGPYHYCIASSCSECQAGLSPCSAF